jgi:hypothetical protein
MKKNKKITELKRKNPDFQYKITTKTLRPKKILLCPRKLLSSQIYEIKTLEETDELDRNSFRIKKEFVEFFNILSFINRINQEQAQLIKKYDRDIVDYRSLENINLEINRYEMDAIENFRNRDRILDKIKEAQVFGEKIKEEIKLESLKIEIIKERLDVVLPYNLQLKKQLDFVEKGLDDSQANAKIVIEKCFKEKSDYLNTLQSKTSILTQIQKIEATRKPLKRHSTAN